MRLRSGAVTLLVACITFVKVVNGSVNLALGKNAYQSTTFAGYGAALAVDGNKETNMVLGRSCTNTGEYGETNPWWMVDLGAAKMITSISITNRGDCCGDKLDGARLLVGNKFDGQELMGDQFGLCTAVYRIHAGETRCFVCDKPVYGRYVAVSLLGRRKTLSLCEVEVYGAQGQTNLALQKPTWQLSTYNQAAASRAVDGDPTPEFSARSCTRTLISNQPWWIVDLGANYMVSTVVVTNRAEPCCYQRLHNAIIGVGVYFDGVTFAPNSFPVCARIATIKMAETKTYKCGAPRFGRYVAIFLPGPRHVLTLCEVQVYASPTPKVFPHKGNLYEFYNINMTWPQATRECAGRNRHLATPQTQPARDFLSSKLRDMGWQKVWIGDSERVQIWQNRPAVEQPGGCPNRQEGDGPGPNCDMLSTYTSQPIATACKRKNPIVCQTGPALKVKKTTHSYFLYNQTVDWTVANITCRSAGGNLVSKDDKVVVDILSNYTRFSRAWDFWVQNKAKGVSQVRKGEDHQTWLSANAASGTGDCTFINSRNKKMEVRSDCEAQLPFICRIHNDILSGNTLAVGDGTTPVTTAPNRPPTKYMTFAVVTGLVVPLIAFAIVAISIIICYRKRKAQRPFQRFTTKAATKVWQVNPHITMIDVMEQNKQKNNDAQSEFSYTVVKNNSVYVTGDNMATPFGVAAPGGAAGGDTYSEANDWQMGSVRSRGSGHSTRSSRVSGLVQRPPQVPVSMQRQASCDGDYSEMNERPYERPYEEGNWSVRGQPSNGYNRRPSHTNVSQASVVAVSNPYNAQSNDEDDAPHTYVSLDTGQPVTTYKQNIFVGTESDNDTFSPEDSNMTGTSMESLDTDGNATGPSLDDLCHETCGDDAYQATYYNGGFEPEQEPNAYSRRIMAPNRGDNLCGMNTKSFSTDDLLNGRKRESRQTFERTASVGSINMCGGGASDNDIPNFDQDIEQMYQDAKLRDETVQYLDSANNEPRNDGLGNGQFSYMDQRMAGCSTFKSPPPNMARPTSRTCNISSPCRAADEQYSSAASISSEVEQLPNIKPLIQAWQQSGMKGNSSNYSSKPDKSNQSSFRSPNSELPQNRRPNGHPNPHMYDDVMSALNARYSRQGGDHMGPLRDSNTFSIDV